MKKFSKKRGALVTHLSEYEVELLRSLVDQLVELVSEGEAELKPDETKDAFEQLVSDLEVDPDEPEVSDDPVIKRLFPNAYPHDAAASSDFRRFTERELKTTKVTEAAQVLERLAATEGGRQELRIPAAEVEVWLRTLTSVRLAVATRLGITDAESAERLAELPEDDPRSYMISVYEWLGFAQETMILALWAHDPRRSGDGGVRGE